MCQQPRAAIPVQIFSVHSFIVAQHQSVIFAVTSSVHTTEWAALGRECVGRQTFRFTCLPSPASNRDLCRGKLSSHYRNTHICCGVRSFARMRGVRKSAEFEKIHMGPHTAVGDNVFCGSQSSVAIALPVCADSDSFVFQVQHQSVILS